MPGHPRRLLSDTLVQWGETRSPPLLVRKGAIVDIVPGSAHETAYGGPSNLQAVTANLGSPDTLDKSALANLGAQE